MHCLVKDSEIVLFQQAYQLCETEPIEHLGALKGPELRFRHHIFWNQKAILLNSEYIISLFALRTAPIACCTCQPSYILYHSVCTHTHSVQCS